MPNPSQEILADEGMQMSHTTKFIELLTMLQREHYTALGSLRKEMAAKLEVMQRDELDARYVADSPLKKEVSDNRRQAIPEISNESTSLNLQEDCEQDPTISEEEKPLDDEHFKTHHLRNELAQLKRFVSSHSSWRSLSRVDDANLPWWRQKLIEVVEWQWFDGVCAFAIITNAVLMGIQIDYAARRVSDPLDGPVVFRVLDRMYTGWFVCELLMKVLAYGTTFWYRHGWAWNVFDFIVVSTDAIQTVFELVEEDGKTMGSFTALRMLRVLRITRAIRVVRLVRFFRELRMMVFSVMRCGMSLLWSMLMFFLIIYIFAIFLLNAVALRVYDNKSDQHYDHYREYWSSLPLGMWTLFSCMSGGVSWMEVGNPLLAISWVYVGTLGFFIFFTIFVVTNIITGIFVDTAIQSAQRDRDEVIEEQLADRDSARAELQVVFEEADDDNSGTLTMEEFVNHLGNEKVRAHLKAIGLHVDEALSLFRLLDINQMNAIGIEEFLFGCMRLKGGATSIDLATLMYENKRIVDGLKMFHEDTRNSLQETRNSLQVILWKLGSLEPVEGGASDSEYAI